jgi:hypothetical protein
VRQFEEGLQQGGRLKSMKVVANLDSLTDFRKLDFHFCVGHFQVPRRNASILEH